MMMTSSSSSAPATPKIHNGRSKRRIHQTVSSSVPCRTTAAASLDQLRHQAVAAYYHHGNGGGESSVGLLSSSMDSCTSSSSSSSRTSSSSSIVGSTATTNTSSTTSVASNNLLQEQQQQRRQEHYDFLTDDCQSLQRSLKRLKVTAKSASPGELCLQRDVKHAVTTQGWIRAAANVTAAAHVWRLPYYNNNKNHEESNNNNVVWLTLHQSTDDPLQLVLDLPAAAATATDAVAAPAVSLWIQVPRLYPHHALEIRRIVYHDHHHHHAASDVPSTTTAAANHHLHPRPTGLHIQVSPDDPMAREYQNNNHHNHNNSNNTVVVVPNWTPLLRLDDILQLLVHVWRPHWNKATHHHHHSAAAAAPTPTRRHTITGATTTTTSSRYHSHSDHLRHPAEADCATEVPPSNSNNNNNAFMYDPHQQQPHPHHKMWFPPNRFDLGYERGGSAGTAGGGSSNMWLLMDQQDCSMQE